MSTAMNFGSKSFQPRPPDKGSFPLDHFGECKRFQEKFMKCLRDNQFENALCRHESKDYLECRMQSHRPLPAPQLPHPWSSDYTDRPDWWWQVWQLMAQEPLEKLGFGDLVDGKADKH